MDLLNTYNNVITKLKHIDYQKLWPNFHLYSVALYNEDTVCYKGKLIPKTPEFLANTSIKYNNEMIGIWFLQNEMDLDVLTSKLVHETFHAFQNDQNEARFPNEIEALLTYNYSETNLSIKFEENKLIVELVDSFDQEKFNKLMRLRKQRMELFPYEFHYEMSIEQIEGTANYIELEVLKQLDITKYNNKLSQMKNELLNLKNLRPIRIVSYSIGGLLIKLLIDHHLDIHFNFDENFYLDHLLKKTKSSQIHVPVSHDIQQILDDYDQTTKRYLDHSIKDENLVLKGDFELLGVNVYNARVKGNHVITEYFLMYKDHTKETILNGNYVIKLNEDHKIAEVYKLIKN